MAKQKTSFFCQNCGASSAKWVGKCPACGEWNTYVEELVSTESSKKTWRSETTRRDRKPVKIHEVTASQADKWTSGDEEFDRVLGGGIVNGSVVLIGGEPGIGKSTLMLQRAISLPDKKVLYVSGEESPQQIKLRADRIGIGSETCYLYAETNLNEIFNQIAEIAPDMLVIDSIQTVFNPDLEAAPGSISQVRDCAGQLMRYAKESAIPVFIIGHINKEGSIAGPKVLEHMVDTVLQFEGDRHNYYRILRTSKNRFGSTSEIGIYEMQAGGLKVVSNPSDILLSKDSNSPGVAVGAILEGNRPLLIEVQILVTPSTYSSPQRSTTGFDAKRLAMLLAVMEKRMGLKLGNQDIFLNITGGIRVNDPSLDLAICAAVFSSYHDLIISHDYCMVGEIGLGGEVRPVSRFDIRANEAHKLGFKELYGSSRQEGVKKGIGLVKKSNLKEILAEVFG